MDEFGEPFVEGDYGVKECVISDEMSSKDFRGYVMLSIFAIGFVIMICIWLIGCFLIIPAIRKSNKNKKKNEE